MRKFLVASLLFLLPSISEAQGDGVLHTYDLRALFPAMDAEGWNQSLAASPVEETGVVKNRGLAKSDERSLAPIFVELLTQYLGEELRKEGREIRMDGSDRLVVLAPADVHAKVRWLLESVRGAVRSQVGIEVDVFTLRKGGGFELPPTNVLEPGAADVLKASLLARGASHEQHVMQVGAGRTAILDATTQTAFLFDYQVEIAHGAHIFDPDVRMVDEGLHFVLRGTAVSGGVHLAAVLRSSAAPDGIRTEGLKVGGYVSGEREGQLTFLQGPEHVQGVDLEQHSIAFNSFLAEGKALFVAMRSGPEDGATHQIILLRKQAGASAWMRLYGTGKDARRLIVINSEALRPPTLTIQRDVVYYEEELGHPIVGATLEQEPSLFLFDYIKKRFAVWRRVGPWALILTDPAWDSGTEDLERILGEFRGETEVHSVAVRVQRDGSPVLSVSLPFLANSECGALVGRTSTALVDYDVEVAQKSAVADPGFSMLFEGLALRMSSSRGESGAVSLELDGVARMFEGRPELNLGSLDPETMEPEDSVFGSLETPRYSELALTDRLHFGDDQGRPARMSLGQGSHLSVEIELR